MQIDAPKEVINCKTLSNSQYCPELDLEKPFLKHPTQGVQVRTLLGILLINTCVLQQVAPITTPKGRPPDILANSAVNQLLHLPF